MKAALEKRVTRLEKANSVQRTGLNKQAQKRALEATSDGDLQLLHDLAARRASFSESSPEQQAALERYQTAYHAVAQTIGAGDRDS